MDNSSFLFCDEVWPSSPDAAAAALSNTNNSSPVQMQSIEEEEDYFRVSLRSSFITEQELEDVYAACLRNDQSYMTRPGYLQFLHSHHHLVSARHRAIQWFIQSRSRLDLSLATVFCAANYLDRFLSMHQCNGWKQWMIEFLSVACLSVASKFNETTSFSYHDFLQMEDLEHYSVGSSSASAIIIQKTELMLLSALGWRINSTTACSLVELLQNFLSSKPHVRRELTDCITDLLLQTLSDTKMVEFRPCSVAISVVKCSLEKVLPSATDNARLISILNKLLPENHKDEMVKCEKILLKQMSADDEVVLSSNKLSRQLGGGVTVTQLDPPPKYKHRASSSPVTVLSSSSASTEESRFSSHVDLCDLFKMPVLGVGLIMTTHQADELLNGSADAKKRKIS